MDCKDRCSKHGHIKEFAIGDRVRLVCTGGRDVCAEIGAVGSVLEFIQPSQSVIYNDELRFKWGGLLRVSFDNGRHSSNHISPRALEKII